MTVNSIPNKTAAQVLNLKAIEGVDKYLANVKTLTIAGTDYTPAALKAVLQAEIDGDNAADESRAQYRQQVVAAKLTRSKGRVLRKGLKAHVLSTFGADNVQTLEAFGISVPKPLGPQTSQAKAQASAAAAATRKARKEALASLDAPAAPSVPALAAAVVTPSKP
jgi:hypothetical protein